MIEVGKDVKLITYGGQEVVRRVVERKKDTIYVCAENEFAKAYQEKREPICVGFNVKYVLGNH